ncbi:MAG: MBL fold metallo-hydrolase [Gammaproteobacteria bacterium]|nr:MBL fold metallo-hydrolase [Gammaproteobacteria bacterium]MCP5136348.1 MBL fold metallo-hydrolase [Gammaproteobacteria bacterium]
MLARLLIVLIALLPFAATANKAPAIPDYQAIEVTDGVWVIHGPLSYPSPENLGFMNNPAWINTNAGVVIVDPGSSVQVGDMVLRVLRAHTDAPVVAVFNTHEHGDHWLGNQAIRAAYPDVPIYGHPNMIAKLDAGLGETWTSLMDGMTKGATAGTVPVGPNHAVDDGEEIAIGDRHFRIHHKGAAHTHSDIMIDVPEVGVVFTGDNANNGRLVRLDDGNVKGNIQNLDHALSLSPKVVVPGHGPSGGQEVIREYRAYLDALYTTVAKLYADGQSDFEMKDAVVTACDHWSGWAGFDDEIGRNLNRAYLEIEAAAF